MKNKNIFGALSLIIVGTVFGIMLVSSIGLVRPSSAEVKVGGDETPVVNVNPDIQKFNNTFVDVAEKVTPSIVAITSVSKMKEQTKNPFHFFFKNEDQSDRKRQGSGSGVIISDDGYILTNNHVVEGSVRLKVVLNDEREFDAEIIGTDPLTDLAVIKIEETDLPEAYLGNSDEVKVGQWVMAIGNPLAYLTSTVTAGIVSAKGRNLRLIKNADGYAIEDFIQTDAVINRGNSGGALVDLNGAVIGVNSAIATDGMSATYIGYGFAIPINIAKTVAEDLIVNGRINRGYIGVQIEAVDAEVAEAVGLDSPRGVLIQRVVEDGAASDEDILEGDIILKIDNKEVDKANELQAYVASKRAGDKVLLTIYRDEKEVKRSIVLKARNQDNTENIKVNSRKNKKNNDSEISEIDFKMIGLKVRDLKGSELDKFNIENGVVITKVEEFSNAYDQRLNRGDIILQVNKEKIKSVEELESIIENKRGSAVLLKVFIPTSNGESVRRLVGLDIPEK